MPASGPGRDAIIRSALPPARRLAALIVVALGIGATCAAAIVAAMSGATSGEFGDLAVYRAAVHVWWGGVSPYTQTYGAGLAFNYPPTALPLLAPLAVAPRVVTGVLMVVTGVALLALVCRWTFARVPPVVLPLLTAAFALSEPFQSTWSYGQVNVYLLAAVAGAVLVRRQGVREGALLGASAGLKISPIVFLLVPVVRHRWREIAAAGVTVGVLAALATLRAPGVVGDWLRQFADSGVIVRPIDRGRSESWLGLLRALLGEGRATTATWLVLCAVLATVGLVTATVSIRRNDDLRALAALALTILLVSPVTWTHHWVWTPLVLGTALTRRPKSLRDGMHLATSTALALATLAWLPAWFATPDHSLATASGQWLVSYSYVLLGTLTLVTLALTSLPDRDLRGRRATRAHLQGTAHPRVPR